MMPTRPATHSNRAILPGRAIGSAVLALLLGGCASFSQDGGMTPVIQHVSNELHVAPRKLTSDADVEAARQAVAAVLSQPLTAEGAVHIALLNNRGLQSRYNELGISEAEYVASSLPENPTVSYQRVSGSGATVTEARLTASVIGLLTLPIRRDIGERQFRSAQYRTVAATFRLAADARRAYYRAVAAANIATYLERALLSAEATADLTRRLGESGAAGKLDQARAASFHAEMANKLRRARLNASMMREALARLLGLWGGEGAFLLPEALPALPSQPKDEGEIEAEAIRRRVDLIAARQDIDTTASALGLTQATRFLSILELSGIRETERRPDESSRSRGFEIAVQIPLFDFGEVNVRRARETYMQSVNRLVEMAVNARSEARAAYRTYRTHYDIAQQYQTRILPLHLAIADETLLRYNGMLIDAFELLATAQESISVTMATIEAFRDFHIAESDLQFALIGGGSGGVEAPSSLGAEATE